MSRNTTSAWIYSPGFDLVFILAPAFIVTCAVMILPDFLHSASKLPLWCWVVFILCIDVAHVYSTLFRTYFDPTELSSRRTLYTMVPILCWIGGVILYSFGSRVFWCALAYVAVFHFVRQQYGLMMIYVRKGQKIPDWSITIDKWSIYWATLYPLIYWHTHLPRNFYWFVDRDFLSIPYPMVERVSFAFYVFIISLYMAKEVYHYFSIGAVNLGKDLLWGGTIISWYVGIVLYNGDLEFTLTNVVTHGVPYIALVWIYGRRKWLMSAAPEVLCSKVASFFNLRMVPIYLLVLITFAYIEEAIWDIFVWHEQKIASVNWFGISQVGSETLLAWLVPLLVVPQATHYVLDAFIWKVRKPDDGFKKLLRVE